MSKLFEVPAIKRNVIFYLETYKTNRVVSKLMKSFADSKSFILDDIGCGKENRIFEISIFSDKQLSDLVHDIKVELIEVILKDTPKNYLFSFREKELGFTNSFKVYSMNGFHFEVCHKIKEVRSNGATALPSNKITQ